MAFPLRVSVNGRYLVDQDGAPFFYHADTAWRLPQRLDRAATRYYLDLCKEQGFTALHVHTINTEKEGPANQGGHPPFAPLSDITRPYEPYWRHLDTVMEEIAMRGFLIVASVAWFGAGGVGWRHHLTRDAAGSYGRFLGVRYRHLPNILWVQGGDNDPGAKAHIAHVLAESIKEVAPHHLHTYHAAAGHASARFFHHAAWLDVNMAYTYDEAYRQVRDEYRRPAPVRPIILGESGYEGEANTGFPWTPALVRRQPYWALLSGAAGHAYGGAGVWHFGAGWRTALDRPARRQMAHVRALFASRPWQTLQPTVDDTLLTAGRGEGAAYAAAARAADGSFAFVYVPTHRTLTIGLASLQGPVTASCFDPTDGSIRAVPDLAQQYGGARTITSPPRNSAGDEDFVLILDAAQRRPR